MNIYLIYPLVFQKKDISSHSFHPFPPLGLVYIATELRKNGHKVEIADRNELLIKNNYDFISMNRELLEKIRLFQPKIIGFSVTTPLMYDVVHFSKEVRKTFPDIVNIVGGPHPTAVPEETLINCPDIDLVIEGEGEMTMLDIASHFPRFDLPGVWSRKGKDFYTVGKRKLVQDLDKISIPDRGLLNMDFYTKSVQERHLFGRHTTIFSSRGCYGRCNFCAGPLMFPGSIRYHSPDYVIEEMEQIVQLYKVDYIYFADDMFLTNLERTRSICEKIKRKKLHKRVKWICQIAAYSAKSEILKIMKDAGCVLVECGFESGSQEELCRMNKNTKVAKYYDFANAAHKTGLNFRANMIKGYIDQTEKDFILSADFIKSIKPYFSHFNNFWPLPGTSVYNELLDRGYKISWKDCTDFAQNFTKISSQRFIELTHDIQKKIIGPLNKSGFIKYHLKYHPIYLYKYYFRKNFNKKRCNKH